MTSLKSPQIWVVPLLFLLACAGSKSKELHGKWQAISVETKGFSPDSIVLHFKENGSFHGVHELDQDGYSGFWKLEQGGEVLVMELDSEEEAQTAWQMSWAGDTMVLRGFPGDPDKPVNMKLLRNEP